MRVVSFIVFGYICTVLYGCREPGITETIITCQTGIRYSRIGYNGNRYNKV